jgi:PHD/YefM family antitoxin component YafN of YafNO toxin-antitoxin module
MLTKEVIGVSEAKANLPRLIRSLESGEQERAVLFRQNHPVAVILPMGVYERLEALETNIEFLEDALAIAKAESMNDGTTWSIKEVRDKLGLLG